MKTHLGITFSGFGLLFCMCSPIWGQAANKIEVSISENDVTLTCPMNDSYWMKKEGNTFKNVTISPSLTIENYLGTQHNGMHYCGKEDNINRIYLQIKECPGCVEMDVWVVTGIIVADLLVTLGVLILTYYLSQKRAARLGGGPAAGGGTRGRPRGQKEDRPPPVPNPDYEPLRKGQRDVYAGLEPRAF
ncbi:T-cell surface glycoprotein CD3 epsilon chain isoform X3 [Eublepharis macularius]|uniref:T-cell surface glycoprotein CD3 epsilon chain n=1 Tax=Eublepharis macularius TaxID=481883 RepID=A0AA97KFE7_EUBMA|nr:T-cell surface glycoprotein CD3 epsilon chain isoform X3 [Eublepharis macularius]